MLVRYWNEHPQIRFLAAGAWNTVFGYLCFVGLFFELGTLVHYLVISVMAHVIAVINAFLIHRIVVFRSKRSWLPEFFRFNVTQLAALFWGLAGLYFCVHVIALSPPLGQAVTLISSLALSYFMHKHFSFAKRQSD